MSDFLSRLIGVVVLRLGPQDLPAGTVPLILAIAFYLAMTGLMMLIGQPPENPLAVLLLAALLPLVLVRIVLNLRRRPERWAQTLTALYGTSAVISALTLPFAVLANNGEMPGPAVFASLVLFVWSFAVDGHIWRHALEVGFVTGIAVAVVLFATSLFIINSLAGPL